jgi:hypothetical protein
MLISRGVFPEMFPQRCGATEKRRGGLTPFARELALVCGLILCDCRSNETTNLGLGVQIPPGAPEIG